MPLGQGATSPTTLQRVERSAGELSSAATRRVEASHELVPRALGGGPLVGRAGRPGGIAAFIAWLRDGGDQTPGHGRRLRHRPRELTRSITLRQTLDLVRSVVDVVEQDATGAGRARRGAGAARVGAALLARDRLRGRRGLRPRR